MKKMVLIIMAVFMIATLGIATANASWYTVNIKATGVGTDGATYINLTDAAATPTFTNMWFILNQATVNAFLATALTAASSGQTLEVFLNGPAASYTTITALYLNNGLY